MAEIRDLPSKCKRKASKEENDPNSLPILKILEMKQNVKTYEEFKEFCMAVGRIYSGSGL